MKLYRNKNLQILFLITLMSVLGVASVTPAFPQIAKQLSISPEKIGLLITVFTLPGVFLTPVLGILADRYGRKRILVPSLFLFGIAGGFCALINDFSLLLAARFLQGIGAASLGSINVTLIGDIFSGKERAEAMGYNASVLSIGTASYPSIGGALALLGWNYPFLLAILAIPIGLIVIFYLQNPDIKNDQKLSAYLLSAWNNIKNRKVFVIFTASIVTFIMLYGAYLTYLPILLSHSFSASSFEIGIMMSAMSLTTALVSSQLGKLNSKFREKNLLAFSFVIYGIALFMIPLFSNIWMLIIPVVIFGIGHGINIPTTQTILAGLAPIQQRGAFMSLNGMVLRLGQTIGPILMGLFFALGGISLVFIAGAVFGILMFLIAFFLFE